MKLISIRNLTYKEVLNDFDCGVELLNKYLKSYALKNDLDNIGKTYLCLEDDKVIGFFTLANGSIKRESLSINKTLPRYPIPVVLLARLAVDINHQRKHIGRFLIQNIIQIVYESSFYSASFGIVVESKPESIGFYELMGFEKTYKEFVCFYPMEKIENYIINKKY